MQYIKDRDVEDLASPWTGLFLRNLHCSTLLYSSNQSFKHF